MQKSRQVLSAHGATIYQECKGIAADVQGTLRTLQSGASGKARDRRRAAGAKGKFF
jgi:hypothetical protein